MPLYQNERTQDLPGRRSDEERKEVELVDSLVQEANEPRTRQGPTGLSLEDSWERNQKRYIGDHWS